MNIDRKLLLSALQVPLENISRTRVLTDIKDRPNTRPSNLPGAGRTGAVMILVYESQKGPSIVLTKRRSTLKHHAGQISLPGGKQDQGENLQQTAVRETEEEVGTPRSQIEILGQLSSVYIPPSDFTIFPFVGWFSGPAHFQRSENEVEEIIETPIAPLLPISALESGRVGVGSTTVDAEFYRVSGHQVWGATAIVLSEFLDRVRALAA